MYITGSALALRCCKVHAKINRTIENSPFCKFLTHEDFNLKLGTRDYVVDVTYHQLFGRIGSVVAFPQIGEYNTFVTFCCLVFIFRSCAQVEPLHLFLRCVAQTTCFRPRTVLLGVTAIDDVIWGNMPPKLPQNGRE